MIDKIKHLIKNTSFSIAIMFASFMFFQFVILRLANQAGQGFLIAEHLEYVYFFIQFIVIAGFFCHVAVYSLIKNRYKYILLLSLIACLILSEIMLYSHEGSVFYLSITAITVFFLGIIGGAVYTKILALSGNFSHTGIGLGIGYSIALLLQFFFQLEFNVKPMLSVLSVLFCIILFSFIYKQSEQAQSTINNTKFIPVSKLIFACVITSALLLFISYYNTYIHHLQIATNYTKYNVYSWPRLLMIIVIIVFGFINDYKNGRFLSICTLCIAMISILNATLIGSKTYALNMCLYYISLSSIIAYYHFTFLRIAPFTKVPVLWAIMGRILDSVIVILSLFINFSTLSTTAVLTIDIILLMGIVVLMAINGELSISALPQQKNIYNTSGVTNDFSLVQNKYSLTPAELKVFKELVLTDDKQDVIAKRMNISVSTLRHHVTSIYKKTNVQTRTSLCKLIINN